MAEIDRLGIAVRNWAERFRGDDSEAAVLVELAIDAADMADRSRGSRDDRTYLAAAGRLQQLIRAVAHGGSVLGAEDAWGDELARVLGAGPGMGNTPQ